MIIKEQQKNFPIDKIFPNKFSNRQARGSWSANDVETLLINLAANVTCKTSPAALILGFAFLHACTQLMMYTKTCTKIEAGKFCAHNNVKMCN